MARTLASKPRSSALPIVAIAAQKGGVGKTTTTVNIATILAERGYRVLVVDIDAQGNSTTLLAHGMAAAAAGTAEVLVADARLEDVVIQTPSGAELCAASSSALRRAEVLLAGEFARERRLDRALQAIPKGRWDICLIDCPPNLGLLTVNALAAADGTLTPVVPAFLSLMSVKQLEETIEAVRDNMNPRLDVLGYLLCQVDAREPRVLEDAREALREHVHDALWLEEVRVDGRLKAPPGAGKGRGLADYEAVANALVRRLNIGRPKSRSN